MSLSDEDLARAARYFAGHQFALNDERKTNVGGAMLREALGEVTGLDVENLRPRYVRLGDAGDVAFEAFAETRRPNTSPALTLAETEALVELLSGTRGTKNKKTILVGALAGATPLEAKYLVKLLVGDLRIGLKEGLVEDAVARAFSQPLAAVAQVNMLTGDIGETAVRARRGRLEGVGLRLFHPLKFMLATAAADLADVARTMPAEFFVEDKFDGIRAQAHAQEAARRALHAHARRGDAPLPRTRRAAEKSTDRRFDRRRDRARPRREDSARSRSCKSGSVARRSRTNCSRRCPSPSSLTICFTPRGVC